MPLSPAQQEVINTPRHDIEICSGGIRSGKTVIMFMKFLHAIETWGFDITIPALVIGESRDVLERNIVNQMLLPLYGNGAINRIRTNSEVLLPSGRSIFFIGGKDADTVGRIQGITACAAMIDEATLVHPDMLSMLLTRLSAETPDGVLAPCYMTTNPGGPAHPFKRIYMDAADDPDSEFTVKVHLMNPDDNPFISDAYKQRTKAMLAAQGRAKLEAFYYGKWVMEEGAVYPRVEDAIVPADTPNRSRGTIYGADFGTVNETFFVRVDRQEDGSLRATDELVLNEGEEMLPTNILIERFAEWKDTHDISDLSTLYMDPTAAPLRAAYQYLDENKPKLLSRVQLRSMNLRDVNAGVGHLNRLMNIGMLTISENCPKLIAQMRGYRWDEKAAERGGVEKVLKERDHGPDSLRYAVLGKTSWWSPLQVKNFVARKAQ